jgi:hypothetical protein
MSSSSSPKHVNVMVPSQSIPISGITGTHSELEIAQAELLADYRDDLMYERIRKFIACYWTALFYALKCLARILQSFHYFSERHPTAM